MIGWLILLMLVVACLGGLWLFRVRGGLLTAAAAALLFGAAGYALQGRPAVPGAPAKGTSDRSIVPLTQLRHAFFGNFSPEESWLGLSEGLARAGNSEDAVGILENATHRYPGSVQLWIGLGNALVDHAHGLTPPAELAYRRASELAPGHPAPPFFYGLAMARSGNPQAAVAVWREVLANAPRDASWRPLVEAGVATLEAPRPRKSPAI
jgi:cytochrome c-type biogenesis protein CcmH